jgi:hypothetical protein
MALTLSHAKFGTRNAANTALKFDIGVSTNFLLLRNPKFDDVCYYILPPDPTVNEFQPLHIS